MVRHFLSRLLLVGCCVALATPLRADTASSAVLPPASQRFAVENSAEEPDFQKHVVPLFGRLGCNGRSCHGSFQGRGGFQLSLFGYDFQFDHEQLTSKDHPRIVPGQVAESLMLQKPLSDDTHEGGQRFSKTDWEYRLLERWVASGAKFEKGDPAHLEKLIVEPAEIVFQREKQTAQLQVIAVWEDGSRENVTPLCRFTSGSDQVAKVDANGVVTANDRGDTFLVVSYDKAVVTVPTMRPLTDLGSEKYPAVATRTAVDKLVAQKLRKLGVVPSPVCSDAEFLRRVSLDLCGTLPSAPEVEAFLQNPSKNKRAEKIEELLATPAYVAWWTTKFCDFTGNNDQQIPGAMGNLAPRQWYDWIYERIEQNKPYDEIVAGIVLGNSRKPGQTYEQFCSDMSDVCRKGSQESFAEWPTLPQYWMRNNFKLPEDRAIGFAYSFMGVRIQCAQCHKHPFDTWSKRDFEEFKGFFTRVNYNRGNARPEDKPLFEKMVADLGLTKTKGNDLEREAFKLLNDGKTVPFGEVYVSAPKPNKSRDKIKESKKDGKRPVPSATARLLGTEEEISLTEMSDPREALVKWLKSPTNPYFARAMANRVWANYFHVGIVEPPDDMSLGNPPSNGPLLQHLSEGFLQSGFDLKWLHREICNSDTYQRSWHPNDSNLADDRNFSHAIPRRLPAEVAYDAIQRATANDERALAMLTELQGRAISIPASSASANSSGKESFALKVFGRSTRESNCDCDRSMEASLLQTVYLQNDNDIMTALTPSKGTWMEQLLPLLSPQEAAAKKSRTEAESLRVESEKLKLRIAEAMKNDKEKSRERVEKLQQRLRELQDQYRALTKKTEPSKVEIHNGADLVRQAYLRTLSRPPAPAEVERSLQFLSQAETPVKGMRDLMWTLLNTKEFIVNH